MNAQETSSDAAEDRSPFPETETHLVDEGASEPFVVRDLSERLPNEALRDELESMSEEEQAAYLRHLEELSRQYLGPGGP